MILTWTAFIICLFLTLFGLYSITLYWKDMKMAKKEQDKEKVEKEAKGIAKMFAWTVVFALITAWLADKLF